MGVIAMRSGHLVKVSEADYEWISSFRWIRYGQGTRAKPYYAMRVTITNGVREHMQMHRLVMDAKPGQIVDHIDGDTLNNRRENLRFVTASQNKCNQHAVTGVSGFKGVVFNKSCKKWQAQIKSRYLGVFDDPKEAAMAYDAAAIRLFGEYARTNKDLGLI